MLQAAFVTAQQENTPVQPMDKTTVCRGHVVSRTTKAVNYRHRRGSTSVDMNGCLGVLNCACGFGDRHGTARFEQSKRRFGTSKGVVGDVSLKADGMVTKSGPAGQVDGNEPWRY
jgi:hypothetical protein